MSEAAPMTRGEAGVQREGSAAGVPGVPMGCVVFVSAGPGAADLITLRGLRQLAQAEVVLADALTDPGFRVLAPTAKWIEVGKRGYRPSTAQAHIDALLLLHAQAGRHVVRLKGGDAGVFGRLEEELQALQRAGVPFDIVPGVTAALAAAADARRPLTRRSRGRSVTLATAVTADTADSNAVASAIGSLSPGTGPIGDSAVFYMAGRQLGRLARQLLVAGWHPETPVYAVSRAGHPDALVSEHRLQALAEAALIHGGRPTVVTVGCAAAPVVAVWPTERAAVNAATAMTPVPFA
jgi:uroporphyrin-III C-methyltransferase